MTDANDKAWEIALEGLSEKERDRIWWIANRLDVDTADPAWVMILATGLTREDIADARERTIADIADARERTIADLADARERTVADIADAHDRTVADIDAARERTTTEIDGAVKDFVAALTSQRATIVQDARKELNAQRKDQEERLREAALEAVNAGVAHKKRATGWKWGALAGVVALLLAGSAFAIGAEVGQQDAAATHDRIAERFQGPYATDEEELLNITNTNLGRADEIIQECQENAFTPDQGGRACQIAVWVKKPDASDARTSRSWPDQIQSWIRNIL